ncbi:MAG TPA: DoxX family protein [Pyrinomonadaceae bacterium]|nr:DoxX family protein [Pyrinomonadaceae bacterium]
MQLIFLLLLLVVPYLLLTFLGQGLDLSKEARARVGLTMFLLFTGLGHFLRTEEMTAMVPPTIPSPREVIYITGVLEILAALGVWIPALMKVTGMCLIAFLIAILPANIYAAFNYLDFGGHGSGPAYLIVRVPFQLLVMWWVYFATEQRWFAGNSSA